MGRELFRVLQERQEGAGRSGHGAAPALGRSGRRLLLLDLQHLLDRRHSGHRLAREAPRVGDRSPQPVAEVDRAAAHAAQHPGVGERPPGQSDEDQIVLRRHVLQRSDHLDLEVLDARAVEDRLSHALHAGLDFAERNDLLTAGGDRGGGQEQQEEGG